MKKSTILIIVIVLIAAISIGTYYTMSNKNKEKTNINENKNNSTTDDKNTTTTDKKILVVYYSAQSHTEAVAKKIANNLDADIFEIVSKDVYTSDDLNWSNDKSRVSREHNLYEM